jgi:threonine/homoserine/homoserine lactone efflux protein
MIELTSYVSFIAVATAVIVTPGPSVMFVVARSVNLGLKNGLVSVLGVASGALAHAIAVSIGLAALLRASFGAFQVIKYFGCFYLVCLGIQTLRSQANQAEAPTDTDVYRWRIFLQGFLVEILNPKTALFFLAFLPQFTSAKGTSVWLQLLILGFTFVLIGLISDAVYAVAAGRIGSWLKRSSRFRKIERILSGTVYTSLGVGGVFYGDRPI